MHLAKRTEQMHCKSCTYWNNQDNKGTCTNPQSASFGRKFIPEWAGCVSWSPQQERKKKS